MRNEFAAPETVAFQNRYCESVAQLLALTPEQYKEARSKYE